MMKAVVSLAVALLGEQRYRGVSWQELVSGAARTDIKSALSALARLGDPAPSLDALIEFARALVFFQWPAILSVAHALVQRRELDHAAFVACLMAPDHFVDEALPLLRRQAVRGPCERWRAAKNGQRHDRCAACRGSRRTGGAVLHGSPAGEALVSLELWDARLVISLRDPIQARKSIGVVPLRHCPAAMRQTHDRVAHHRCARRKSNGRHPSQVRAPFPHSSFIVLRCTVNGERLLRAAASDICSREDTE
jgi:hypothetical protein